MGVPTYSYALRLLDIANGASIIVERQTLLSTDQYQEITDVGALFVIQQTFVPLTRQEYWAAQSCHWKTRCRWELCETPLRVAKWGYWDMLGEKLCGISYDSILCQDQHHTVNATILAILDEL